jgi:hypothetical protein
MDQVRIIIKGGVWRNTGEHSVDTAAYITDM